MTAGIQAYTAAGVLQFDASTFVMCCQGKATVTASTTYGFGKSYDVVITGARTPMLAIRSTTTYFAIMNVQKSGTTWTFRVVTYGGDYTFTYYYFDSPDPSITDNFGIEVYSPAGDLVFTSAQPPMNLRGESPQSSGPTYAALYTGVVTYHEDVSFDTSMTGYVTWSYTVDMAISTSTGVTIDTKILENGGGPGTAGPGFSYDANGNGFYNGAAQIIDVTVL